MPCGGGAGGGGAGACEMSCVNEQSYGPLHLLPRLTTTGWQLYELCTRLSSIQHVAARRSEGEAAEKISLHSGEKDKWVLTLLSLP